MAVSTNPRRHAPTDDGLTPFASSMLLLAAFLVWILRFDYGFGYGDQDEFIPYLLGLLDNSLFQQDWYVQTQIDNVGVRTYFVFLLRGLCAVLSPRAAVAFVFVASWLVIAASVMRITVGLGGRRVAVVFSVLGVMCLTPKWTLGGNDLVYSMLVPEMVAWALVLPAIVQLGRERYALCGVLLGIAAWFQLLAGILSAGMIGLAVVLRGRSRVALRHALLILVSTAVAALPVLIPVAFQQFGGRPSTSGYLHILTEFRAPHHYLPSAFSIGSWFRFGLLVVLALPASWLLLGRNGQRHHVPAMYLLAAVGLICIAAWFFVEVVPIDLVIKLQLFKLTVVAKLLLVVILAVSGETLLSRSRLMRNALTARRLSVATAMFVILAGFSILWRQWSDPRFPGESGSWRAQGVEEWARNRSPAGAVFVLPPSNSSFRSYARRAIVVNYAAFPFAPADMQEWYRRIRTIAPVQTSLPDRNLLARLDSSYHARTPADWRRLADTFGIDYLVRRSEPGADMPFPEVYRDASWVAYRVR